MIGTSITHGKNKPGKRETRIRTRDEGKAEKWDDVVEEVIMIRGNSAKIKKNSDQ